MNWLTGKAIESHPIRSFRYKGLNLADLIGWNHQQDEDLPLVNITVKIVFWKSRPKILHFGGFGLPQL